MSSQRPFTSPGYQTPQHRTGAIYESPDGDGPNKLQRGSEAERRAELLLTKKGYRIVERNFRTKLGEIDLIAHDGTTLVFVEVRSRRTSEYGSALEAVGWRKQRKVSRVAAQYMAKRRPRCLAVRFDVVGITGEEIVHIQDAWRLSA
jgi:putative endonuclease